MSTIRTPATPLAAAASQEHRTYQAYVAEVLPAGCDNRKARRRIGWMKEAKISRAKPLDEFATTATPDLLPAHLATGAWIEAGQSLVLLGSSDTGKDHLLIGLGTAAAEQRRRVRYVSTAALVNEHAEAADTKKLSEVVGRYWRLDLLCLDELSYVHLDARRAELLFQIITEREERASIACATNAPFSEWGAACTVLR